MKTISEFMNRQTVVYLPKLDAAVRTESDGSGGFRLRLNRGVAIPIQVDEPAKDALHRLFRANADDLLAAVAESTESVRMTEVRNQPDARSLDLSLKDVRVVIDKPLRRLPVRLDVVPRPDTDGMCVSLRWAPKFGGWGPVGNRYIDCSPTDKLYPLLRELLHHCAPEIIDAMLDNAITVLCEEYQTTGDAPP